MKSTANLLSPASPGPKSPPRSPGTKRDYKTGARAAKAWGKLDGVSRHVIAAPQQALYGPLALHLHVTRVGTHAVQLRCRGERFDTPLCAKPSAAARISRPRPLALFLSLLP